MNMKVYEVISENNLDEGLGNLLYKGIGALGKAVTGRLGSKTEFAEKAGEYIASIAKSRGISVARAAEQVFATPTPAQEQAISRAVRSGFSREKAMERLGLQTHPYYSDAAIKAKAISHAESMPGRELLGKIGIKSGGDLAFTAAKYSLNAWGIYELWGPWSDYKKQVELGQKKLESREWDQATFQAWVNRQTTILIGNEARLLTAAVIGKVFSGVAGKLIGAAFPRVGAIVSKLGPAAALTYFGTQESRESLAAGILSVMGPEVTDYIGGVLSPFTEKLRSLDPTGGNTIPAAGSAAAPQDLTTGNTAKQDIGSTSTPANGAGTTATDEPYDPHKASASQMSGSGSGKTAMGRKMYYNDPNTINNYDITGWISKPGQPTFIQDPKNPANFLPKPSGWTPN
jgi:hypothetical protein